MATDMSIDHLISMYDASRHDISIFMRTVLAHIAEHPDLASCTPPIVHSFKSRLKDRDHLRSKILRKIAAGKDIGESNFFTNVTDLAGVRILHLFQEDFLHIDRVVRRKVDLGDWALAEKPLAYTWDPEAANFFRRFDVQVSEKATSYTSVHYLLKPRSDSLIHCELQVRTLFEEIWGEVDHQINYPLPSESIACREQLKVLSKIVGAGSRLLDSLQRVQRTESVVATAAPASSNSSPPDPVPRA